ncbi:MAG: amidohydrolase family protein [Acidobacteriia bacterium]|nr:amidohydrolase family protein [Terriglobia bacterium]
MRIDAAVQFCLRSRFSYPWMQEAPAHMQRDFTPEDLWRILSRNKYEGAIACTESGGEETSWLLELAASQSWIVGVIGDGLAQAGQLDLWQRQGKLCGVRLCVRDCTRLRLRELERRGLPCDLDLAGDWSQLARIADTAPGLDLALAHMGRPNFGRDFDGWAQAMETAATIPRLVIKISGLIKDAGVGGWKADTYRPYIQHLMRVFAAERLLYGSDWPGCMQTGTWKESLAAFTQSLGAQTMETRSLILGENALRHYRITLTD